MEAIPIADVAPPPHVPSCDKACLERGEKCAACQFDKLNPVWSAELRRLHLVNTRPHSMPIVRSVPGEAFHLSCIYCRTDTAARNKRDRFALGLVDGFSQMQIGYMKRHCQSDLHINAAKAQGVTVVLPEHVLKKSVEQRVFPVPMFLWGLTCCFTGSSYSDYRKFVQSHDVLKNLDGVDMPAERVGHYAHHKSCQQIVHSFGGLILEEHQSFMGSAVRLAIGADDRDPDRLLRGRVVRPNPTIEVKDFNLALIREHGTFPDDAADAVIDGLKEFCTLRRGVQDRTSLTGKENVVDTKLLAHCKSILFQATSDGCETEVLGMRQLKVRRLCPFLRYFFRDRPHTSQSIHKAVIRSLRPENKVLLQLLISDEGSFAKRVRYSRPFRKIWKEEAGTEDDLEALYTACDHLAYAEQRFDSRSKPMTRLVKNAARITRVLKRVAADPEPAHRDDVVWAKHLLKSLSGVDGFLRFLDFTVETDFFVTARCLSQLQDKTNTDISVSQHEVLDTLAVHEALFNEGRIFSQERNDSYTWEFLNSARGNMDIYTGSDPHNSMAWPTQQKLFEKPMLLARSLYAMSKEFVTVNYPDFSWRSRFSCFDNSEHRQPEQVRLDAIELIAAKERVDKHQCRQQFYEAIPVAKKLYAEFGCNKKVWTIIAERQRINRGARFRADTAPLLCVIFTYLGIMDTTGDLERTFAKLCWLTLKHRSTHMHLFSLMDALRIATTLPSDIRLYLGHNQYRAFENSTQLKTTLEPGTLVQKAQYKCHEYFGTKRCATSQFVSELGPSKRARHEAAKSESVSKVQLRKVEPKQISERQRHDMWVKSAKSMVESMRTDTHCRSVGIPVAERKTIFGTDVPDPARTAPQSALQKATLKAIRKRAAESLADFKKDESEIDYSRSVRPVRADFRRKRLPASAPKFKAATEAIAKALVSQKVASANRTIPRGPAKASAAFAAKSGCSHGSASKSPSGSAAAPGPARASAAFAAKSGCSPAPQGPARASAASGKRQPTSFAPACPAAKRARCTEHAAVWCTPAARVTSTMPWFVEKGSSWSLVDTITEASVVVIAAEHWPEESTSGTAALHCKLYGKQLVSDRFIGNPHVCGQFLNFSNGFVKKGERQQKYRLFISDAAKDKHQTMYRDLLTCAAAPASPKHRTYYAISVQCGGAGDVMQAIKRCQSAADVRPIKWLVCKSEVKDCTLALSAALRMPPSEMTKRVLTMSQFVQEIGRVQC